MNACLFFGNTFQENEKLTYDEIAKKYGVRVWKRDKLFIHLIEETSTHFKGYADGIGNVGRIPVEIEKSDVVSISRLTSDGGTSQWKYL